MESKEIIPFIDPIYRYCHRRLNNWHDAEDLAHEILLHVLDGMGKYDIESLEAWVWRIAHNRYARFVAAFNKKRTMLSDQELFEIEDDYCQIDEELVEEEYEPVFRSLHTLSSQYRDLFVDYYIGEMSVKQLAEKYFLTETTVKWRLNVGRSRIRERIGVNRMDKVYKRINWNTNSCNGSMDSDRYLHTQIARAICQAAYEKPLTVEEISLCTGIPAMYIEDELSRLEYGDAIQKYGNKYATDFIIFRLQDRADTEAALDSMVHELADHYEELLWNGKRNCRQLGFYGSDFGMERLGYILVPYFIRQKMKDLKNNCLHLPNGEFPPRKDGGYGWFIVPETVDESENDGEYSAGCNVNAVADAAGEGGNIYYYWINKYFDCDVYRNRGTAWLGQNGIPLKCADGVIPEGMLKEDDIVQLLRNNLIRRDKKGYRLNFACFTKEEFMEFCALYMGDDESLDCLLSRWILSVRRSFEKFVPKRLYSQINQWVSIYCGEIIGQVMEELIHRGRLEKPGAENRKTGQAGSEQAEYRNKKIQGEKPLVDGIFYVEGEYMLI